MTPPILPEPNHRSKLTTKEYRAMIDAKYGLKSDEEYERERKQKSFNELLEDVKQICSQHPNVNDYLL